jgi:serralysin
MSIKGNGKNNKLNGTSKGDQIFGFGGNDTIDGKGGGDRIKGGAGNDRISGGSGADTITGNKGIDTIFGDAGDDIINGGEGKDTLTGGSGKDTFIFKTTLNAKNNVDTITDYVHGQDSFKLSSAVFAGLGKGKLSEDAFHIGKVAADKEDRILYDKEHGDLYFDRDGSKSHYDPVKFAHLNDSNGEFAALDHTDFLTV